MNRRTGGRKFGFTSLVVVFGLMAVVCVGASQVLSGHVAWKETTLFSDNFDSHMLGSFPSRGGWEVVWGGRDTGRDPKDPPANVVTWGPSVSQPQSFQLWGKPNWSAVVQRKFSTTVPIIGYEFAIQIEKIGTGTPGREESPGFFCREAAQWGGYYARVFFDHDTRQIRGEGGVVLGRWSPGVWYRVKVILFRGTAGLSVYSVWIDGQLVGQNIRTEGETSRINALALFSGHPGVKVWYDNVRVFSVSGFTTVSSPEWHIDFQGDYFHAGTYGQTGPVAHSETGVTWNVFEVPALKGPFPTPRATNPSMLLREKSGLMTGAAFTIEGDAYGWAGWTGGNSLLDDYLIHVNNNAHGVLNNPTWWKIRGLAPNTRYCLTFYHHITDPKRGLVFSVLNAFHRSIVEVDHRRHVSCVCVWSSGEGTITANTAVDDRLGVEGDWAALSIRVRPAQDGDYGDAPDPSFPTRYGDSGDGPYHVDVSKEWIGPAGKSTTTTEPDSRGTNLDQDDGDPIFWRTTLLDDETQLPVASAVWFGVQVSYDPTKSSAKDPRYLNVLVDIDGSGSWDIVLGGGGDEWAVRNFEIPFDALPAGVCTKFVIARVPDSIDPDKIHGRCWVRVTLSDRPVADGSGRWGLFARGETEDHLARKGEPLAKFKNMTTERVLHAKLRDGARMGTCPHGVVGAMLVQGSSPYFWTVDIPTGITKIEIQLRQDPRCQCFVLPGLLPPRCVRLDPAKAFLVSPNGTQFAWLNAGWDDITPSPRNRLGFKWGMNTVDGSFFWLSIPEGGHAQDCVVVELRITFDPDGEYGTIYDYVPVMLIPFGLH